MATFAFEEYILDDVRAELWQRGKRVVVERQPFEVLLFLLRHPGRIVTKEELTDAVWEGRALSKNVISVCVARLRKALGGTPDRYIRSAYGRGYRFVAPIRVVDDEPERLDSAPSLALPVPLNAADCLVGRSAVLMRLRSALSQAASGRGGVCTLVGEAGIGKTRIAEELHADAIAKEFLVSWGRCHVLEDTPPLWPWLQAVQSCEALLPMSLRNQTTGCVVKPALLDQVNSSEHNLDQQSCNAWHTTVAWLHAVLRHVSAQRPWLIVIEDIQWADAATLALLTHVVAEVSKSRVLLILTARDTELPNDSHRKPALEYLLSHRDCEAIELPRLSEGDVETYVEHRFGPVDKALTAAVFKQSEGNPFFMLELLRPWANGGRAPNAKDLTISGYALGIIRQRIRRLDSDVVEILSAASVIGRSFDTALLSCVSKRPLEIVTAAIEASLHAGMVETHAYSATQYSFNHELIRRVLYDGVSNFARMCLHQHVADTLLARVDSASPMALAQIAHHLLRGLPEGAIERTVGAARQAAASAACLGAYADACDLLRRALELCRSRVECEPRLLSSVLYDLARCERAAGEEGSAKHFAEAVRLARTHGFVDILFSAGTRMSGAPGTVAMPEAAAVLGQALDALPTGEDSRRAILLSYLAWTSPSCRDSTRVASLLEQAEKYAGAGGRSAKRALLRSRLYFAGGPDEQDYCQALALAAQLDHLAYKSDLPQRAFLAIEPSLARIMLLMQRCEFQAAEKALDVYGAAARELHHAELTWHFERTGIVLRMRDGNIPLAREQLMTLKGKADRLELQGRRAIAAMDWAELNRLTTDIRPVASQFARTLSASPDDDPTVQTGKLRALVQFGLIDEARLALQHLPPDQLQALPKSRNYLAQLANVSIAAAATGSPAHAEMLYRLLRPYPDRYVASLSLHCYGLVSHILGSLSLVLGERRRACEHLEDAVEREAALGLRLPLVRSRLDLGSLLIESKKHSDRVRGTFLLTTARNDAIELGLEPIKAEVEIVLGGASSMQESLRS